MVNVCTTRAANSLCYQGPATACQPGPLNAWQLSSCWAYTSRVTWNGCNISTPSRRRLHRDCTYSSSWNDQALGMMTCCTSTSRWFGQYWSMPVLCGTPVSPLHRRRHWSRCSAERCRSFSKTATTRCRSSEPNLTCWSHDATSWMSTSSAVSWPSRHVCTICYGTDCGIQENLKL